MLNSSCFIWLANDSPRRRYAAYPDPSCRLMADDKLRRPVLLTLLGRGSQRQPRRGDSRRAKDIVEMMNQRLR